MNIDKECKELISYLALNLKNWITENKISQRQLARLSHSSESTIRAIMKEPQNIELATLVKFKLVFSVSLNDLMTIKGKTPKIRTAPLTEESIKIAVEKEQRQLGLRILKKMKEQKINPEELSILALNIDYSDTLKYLKGTINLTLLTILKLAFGLNIDKRILLR